MNYVGAGCHSSRPPIPGGMQWLDPADFRPAAAGVGSLGRGALAGPGFWNCDLAVLKSLGPTERRFRIQLRGEFYNAFNHANLPAPWTLYGGFSD